MSYYEDWCECPDPFGEDPDFDVMCNRCSSHDVFWVETDKGWRLHEYNDDGNVILHHCQPDVLALFRKIK